MLGNFDSEEHIHTESFHMRRLQRVGNDGKTRSVRLDGIRPTLQGPRGETEEEAVIIFH